MPDTPVAALPAPPDHLEPRHRRFVITESMIGTVMGGLLPALVILLARPFLPAPVFGHNSIASGLLLGTLVPGTTVPIAISLVVRWRVRRGTAPALGWPLRTPGFLRFLGRSLPVRGLIAGVAGLAILPPLGLGLMMLFGVRSVSAAGFIAYNAAHGMALSLLILPPVITLALADGVRLRQKDGGPTPGPGYVA